jgi:hypothetical protein
MKLISKFKRISIIEKDNKRFVQLRDEDRTLTDKFLEAKNLGQVGGVKLTLEECQYLLHH